MSIHLNHTIVSARDAEGSARFLSAILGLAAPETVGPFAVAQIGEASLAFIETEEEIQPQHYEFLVSEAELGAIFERIKVGGLSYWADPSRRNEGRINSWDGGRGLYAACIGTIPTGISWKSSRGPMPAAARRPTIPIRWSPKTAEVCSVLAAVPKRLCHSGRF